MRLALLAVLLVVLSLSGCALDAVSWPQFRGVNGAGLAQGEGALPVDISPDRHVVWKTELPFGHSSPVVTAERVFLTAVEPGEEQETLWTYALDRATGKVAWRRQAPARELERIHGIGSRAQSSCASDGERVVSFFGSCGLLCYDSGGELLWKRPMGPFKNGFGAGSSPIIVDDRVILSQDHDVDSFVMAVDKRTGNPLWKTDRGEFPRGFSTPVVWEVDGEKQIVVAGTLAIVGYDLESGEELWRVKGIARIVNTTPVVGADGHLYYAGWSPGADPGEEIEAEPFAALLNAHDASKSGTLEASEIPDGPLARRFDQLDRDKDGKVTAEEYRPMRLIFERARNVILKIKPGGRGDISESHVLWRHGKYLPYVPSPLAHGAHLFTVKNGGIVMSASCATGEPIKVGRISARGNFYSSPVGGDGKIYLLSERGGLSVISADPEWEELHSAEFGEDVYGTPALVDGRVYLRTRGHLYCFGAE